MKKWIVVFLLVFVVAGSIGLYFFFKAPADVRSQDPDFELTASELVERYADEAGANQLYLGKILAISGTVASVSEENGNWTVFLETNDPISGVTCSCYPEEAESIKTLKAGDHVTMKGECTGKLMDIVLNHCSIVK